MAELTSNASQTVEAGQNVIYTETAVSGNCNVIHREGSGIVTLRGNSVGCCSFARYKCTFGANIAIPADGTVEQISLALAIDGEPIPTSRMIVTPAAVGDLWNVNAEIYITVPRGCCYTISCQNTSTQAVDVQNTNLIVERVA